MNNDDDKVSFVFGAPHPHVEFDLDAIEAKPGEPIVLDMGEQTVDRLVVALDAVLDWLVPHRAKPQTVMIRACHPTRCARVQESARTIAQARRLSMGYQPPGDRVP